MVESSLEFGGAVVFWTAAELTDRAKLQQAFEALGLGLFVPDPQPDSAVLRYALEEVFGGPRTLVRPLADRDGFAVVREDRGKVDNRYSTLVSARLAGSSLTVDPWTSQAGDVQRAYDRQRGRLMASQLSACLVKVIESLGGTRLRPTGAVYWVPGHRLDQWSDVARAVESAHEGKATAVYLLRHQFDAEAVRAVRDAVVAEVQQQATRIQQEVLQGELGSRALETRQRQAQDLRDKVLLYEELLQVGLSELHQVVDSADQATATAGLLLSSLSHATSPQPVGVG